MTTHKTVLLLETMRICDGRLCLPELHRARMERSCRELYGCAAPDLCIDVAGLPEELRRGTVKCRVTYGPEIASIEYEPYSPRQVRRLKLVSGGDVDYHLKYADRGRLAALAALRGEADDVLIVRDGLVTDSSYANILLRAGDRLLTPARPLLEGVMRRHLLDSGEVEEAEVTPSMLMSGNREGVTEVMLVNAMMPPGALPPVPLSRILQ